MKAVRFEDGIAICGTFPDDEIQELLLDTCGKFPLIVADPPYGNILKNKWDKVGPDDKQFCKTMIGWTNSCAELQAERGALYMFGGIGIPNFRPFYRFMSDVECDTPYKIANHITWSKKRAYGIKHNYLFTREEVAYLHLGDDIKLPRCFNIPLLDTKRGYAGFNPDYPAKSEFYRRTSVWTDIEEGSPSQKRVSGAVLSPHGDVWEVTELMRGKWHDAQKPVAVMQIPIETHTIEGEWVLDPFAGSGTTAHAARKCGRQFAVIEEDEANFDKLCKELELGVREK